MIRLFVESATAFDEVRDVGDVDAQLPGAVVFAGEADGVVVVLGVVGVDGADQLAGQVKPLGLLALRIEGSRHFARGIEDVLRELLRQAVLDDGAVQVDVLLARIAEHLGDDALGPAAVVGEAGDLDDDLLARLDVLAAGIRHGNRFRATLAVWEDEPLALELPDGACESGLTTLDDVEDPAFVHLLAVALARRDDLGPHHVARHRTQLIAWRDEEVFVTSCLLWQHKAKTLRIRSIGADQLVVADSARWHQDGAGAAEDDVAVIHHVLERAAERAVVGDALPGVTLSLSNGGGELSGPHRGVPLGRDALEDVLTKEIDLVIAGHSDVLYKSGSQ